MVFWSYLHVYTKNIQIFKLLNVLTTGPEELRSFVHIESATGEIVVASRIDHEMYSWLNLTVKAVDSGVPRRYSVVDLFIQVCIEL